MSYSVWVCPKCGEQIQADGYDGMQGHGHDGVGYTPVEVPVQADLRWAGSLAFVAQVEKDEQAHRETEAKRAADAAELAAMEAEWHASAPAEQLEAYAASQARARRLATSMHDVLKETWGSLNDQTTSVGFSWQNRPSPFSTDAERDAYYAEVRAMRRQELEGTLALFESEGPARVSFWKLRDTRRELAELDAEMA